MKKVLMVSCMMILMAIFMPKTNAKCAFEAVFCFGDSNSDTGGFYAAFPSQPSPNGMTYFKKPTGRPTDGRLYLDFLAQALGLPFISPYLQSIGSDYKHGANFATSASTVLLPNTSLFVSGLSPFSLAIQLNQMKHLKAKVDEQLHSKGEANLPSPDIFGKALYTIYIGQNDFTSKLAELGISGVQKYLPQVVSEIAKTIKELYWLGGRTFAVLNLAPIGCYPMFLVNLPHKSTDLDEYGCMTSYNNAVIEYNKMLKATLNHVKQVLGDANVVYIDTHAILLDLFQHPKSHGMIHSTRACCGYGGGAHNFSRRVFCGYNTVINGKTVTAKGCNDPQNYVSWDGIHVTEVANKIIAYGILNGSYSYPNFAFNQFCDLQPIG